MDIFQCRRKSFSESELSNASIGEVKRWNIKTGMWVHYGVTYVMEEYHLSVICSTLTLSKSMVVDLWLELKCNASIMTCYHFICVQFHIKLTSSTAFDPRFLMCIEMIINNWKNTWTESYEIRLPWPIIHETEISKSFQYQVP